MVEGFQVEECQERGAMAEGYQGEGVSGGGGPGEGRHDGGVPWHRGAMKEAPQDIGRLWGWTSRERKAEPTMGKAAGKQQTGSEVWP